MKELRVTSTGWWGLPGQDNPKAKVHAVCDQKPICGAHIHPKAEYQFCSSGLAYNYLECANCKAMVGRHAIAAAKAKPLKGKRVTEMTEAQAVEEITRVCDGLASVEQTVSKLKMRLHNAWAVLVG